MRAALRLRTHATRIPAGGVKTKPRKSARTKNSRKKLLSEKVFRTHLGIVSRKHKWQSSAFRREMLRRLRSYRTGNEIPYGFLLILRRSLQQKFTPLIKPAQLLAQPTSAFHVPSAFVWILQDQASAREAAVLRQLLRGRYRTVRRHVEIAIDALNRAPSPSSHLLLTCRRRSSIVWADFSAPAREITYF